MLDAADLVFALKLHAGCCQVVESLRAGHQAMVFVHSRKETGNAARMLAQKAQLAGDAALFDASELPQYGLAQKEVQKSRNRCAWTELGDPLQWMGHVWHSGCDCHLMHTSDLHQM